MAEEMKLVSEEVEPSEYLDLTSQFTTNTVFYSRDDMIKWVRDSGKAVGSVIVIKRADIFKRTPRTTFCCERGGKYRDARKTTLKEQFSVRHTGTKRCGCPFTLKGIKMPIDDQWMIQVVCGFHNHALAHHFEGHSFVGRLNNDEKHMLADMAKSCVKPRSILNVLKGRDPNNASTMKTIYNARASFRRIEAAGRTEMQQLMKKLEEYQYVERHRNSDTLLVTDLLWAHPECIQLANCFPIVWLMDCTYKTNRYRLPLLEIVGITSTNMTYSIAFVYLQAEKEENFVWALENLKSVLNSEALPSIIVTDRELALMNACKRVFPKAQNFLCRFHISRNILSRCKKMFARKEAWDQFISKWNDLVLSSTEEDYKDRLDSFEIEFSQYSNAVRYVKENWLTQYKQYFVAAWTDQNIHFGNTTTNRAESAHAKLKRHLMTSQAKFDTSWDTINSLLELQHVEINATFERSLNIVKHKHRVAVCKELTGFVSLDALELIVNEAKRAESCGPDDLQACGCVIRRTHGLPCAHEIAVYKREHRHILLSSIHPHWMKLSNVPTVTTDEVLECGPLVQQFIEKYDKCSESGKNELFRKLKDIVNPASTLLLEPKEKITTRGRPRTPSAKRLAQAESSTKRDPTAFEILSIEDKQSQTRPQRKKLAIKRKQRTRSSQKENPSLDESPYLADLPTGLEDYILQIKDVRSDGNCGFRAVAALMGMGEDEWPIVRRDMIAELQVHADYYAKLYGGQQTVTELIQCLDCFDIFPPTKCWMTLPEMGHIIASCYNIVLLHFSSRLCLTYLPLLSPPEPLMRRKIIAIAFINNNHFVQLLMRDNCPIPNVAVNWTRHVDPIAVGWRIGYEDRMQKFGELVGPDVATSEVPIIVND